jgi:hypothetical protein
VSRSQRPRRNSHGPPTTHVRYRPVPRSPSSAQPTAVGRFCTRGLLMFQRGTAFHRASAERRIRRPTGAQPSRCPERPATISYRGTRDCPRRPVVYAGQGLSLADNFNLTQELRWLKGHCFAEVDEPWNLDKVLLLLRERMNYLSEVLRTLDQLCTPAWLNALRDVKSRHCGAPPCVPVLMTYIIFAFFIFVDGAIQLEEHLAATGRPTRRTFSVRACAPTERALNERRREIQ